MTKQEEMEKRFDENWDILSDIVNTYGDTKAKIYLKSFILEEIDLAIADRNKELEKSLTLLCARHSTWKPTEGYGSEEEKGYQKGIQAEGKLFANDILSLITKDNE